jgi:LysM repeat protein
LFELDKNDYKNWAHGLKQAGYATNPKYPDLLINLIEKYRLYEYDQPETEAQKLRREDRVFTEINANIPQEKKKFTPVSVPPSQKVITESQVLEKVAPVNTSTTVIDGKYYVVTKGDTLYNISKRFNLTVEELQSMNTLLDEGIKIGQKLQVVK